MVKRFNSETSLGKIALLVLQHNMHRPIVEGQCNRIRVDDAIFEGVYAGVFPPMNEKDVEYVCDLIDDLINLPGVKK